MSSQYDHSLIAFAIADVRNSHPPPPPLFALLAFNSRAWLYFTTKCVRGMLDMLGETTQQLQEQQQQPETEAAFDAPYQTLPNEALTAITAELEDPDDILTGGGVLSKGGDIFSSTPARTSAPPSGSYSLLVPHLLDLVAYQSGVEAVEVSEHFVLQGRL